MVEPPKASTVRNIIIALTLLISLVLNLYLLEVNSDVFSHHLSGYELTGNPHSSRAGNVHGEDSGEQETFLPEETKPFRFHVYKLDEEEKVHEPRQIYDTMFSDSSGRKHYLGENYVATNLRHHSKHTENKDEADIFIVPIIHSFWNFAGKAGCVKCGSFTRDVFKAILEEHYASEMYGWDHYVFNIWWKDYNNQYMENIAYISDGYRTASGFCTRKEFFDRFDRSSRDILAPYYTIPPKTTGQTHSISQNRTYFMVFLGSINVNSYAAASLRRNLKNAMENAENRFGVEFMDFGQQRGNITKFGMLEDFMGNSTFCPTTVGDAEPTSRFYTAILAGCIPVVFCDFCMFAFERFFPF